MPAGEAVEALVCPEAGAPWKLETVYLDPKTLQHDEVLVDITASGLCHSDLSFTDGSVPRAYPTVVGHEGVGVVREIGTSITRCKKGDKVMLSWAYCRRCRPCKKGHPAQCDMFDEFNQTGMRQRGEATYTDADGKTISAVMLGTSSFARATIVNESTIINLGQPKSDMVDLCPLGCGYLTGAGAAINVAKPQSGDSVVVFGLGAVGSGAIMGAKLSPATTIIAIDLQANRLESAKKLGATHTINARETKDVVQAIKDLTGGLGVDYAFECTGVVDVFKQAYDALGCGGKLIHIGVPQFTKEFSFNIMGNLRYQKSIIGCIEGDSVPENLIPQLVQLYEAGRFPFSQLSKKYSFKDHQAAVDDMKSGKVIKPILVWD